MNNVIVLHPGQRIVPCSLPDIEPVIRPAQRALGGMPWWQFVLRAAVATICGLAAAITIPTIITILSAMAR